jgi:hypothetical protein
MFKLTKVSQVKGIRPGKDPKSSFKVDQASSKIIGRSSSQPFTSPKTSLSSRAHSRQNSPSNRPKTPLKLEIYRRGLVNASLSDAALINLEKHYNILVEYTSVILKNEIADLQNRLNLMNSGLSDQI